MERNTKGSGNRGNERPDTVSDLEALVHTQGTVLQDQDSSTPSVSPSLIRTQRFPLPGMHESRYVQMSPAPEPSMPDYEYLSGLAQNTLPEMSTPKFEDSSFQEPDIPLERPHCPVPNTRMFMPAHIFNPQLFPPPVHAVYSYNANMPHVEISSPDSDCVPEIHQMIYPLTNVPHVEVSSPDSDCVPEIRRMIYPITSRLLNYVPNTVYRPPVLNPPAPQRLFNINEPGPSCRHNVPVAGVLAQMPPLSPLSVDIPVPNDSAQMSNLHGEFRRVTKIFSKLATDARGNVGASQPRTVRTRQVVNPYVRLHAEPSIMWSKIADGSNVEPTKAKQLKTKTTVVKSSQPKVSKAGRSTAPQSAAGQSSSARSNVGHITAPSTSRNSTTGRPSKSKLPIVKPSKLSDTTRKDVITQTNPPQYNSFAGMFRHVPSDSDDEMDDYGNPNKAQRNLKRRYSDKDA